MLWGFEECLSLAMSSDSRETESLMEQVTDRIRLSLGGEDTPNNVAVQLHQNLMLSRIP